MDNNENNDKICKNKATGLAGKPGNTTIIIPAADIICYIHLINKIISTITLSLIGIIICFLFVRKDLMNKKAALAGIIISFTILYRTICSIAPALTLVYLLKLFFAGW